MPQKHPPASVAYSKPAAGRSGAAWLPRMTVRFRAAARRRSRKLGCRTRETRARYADQSPARRTGLAVRGPRDDVADAVEDRTHKVHRRRARHDPMPARDAGEAGPGLMCCLRAEKRVPVVGRPRRTRWRSRQPPGRTWVCKSCHVTVRARRAVRDACGGHPNPPG